MTRLIVLCFMFVFFFAGCSLKTAQPAITPSATTALQPRISAAQAEQIIKKWTNGRRSILFTEQKPQEYRGMTFYRIQEVMDDFETYGSTRTIGRYCVNAITGEAFEEGIVDPDQLIPLKNIICIDKDINVACFGREKTQLSSDNRVKYSVFNVTSKRLKIR